MLGKLEVEGGGEVSAFTDPNLRNLVSEVSITEPRVFGKGNPVKVSPLVLVTRRSGGIAVCSWRECRWCARVYCCCMCAGVLMCYERRLAAMLYIPEYMIHRKCVFFLALIIEQKNHLGKVETSIVSKHLLSCLLYRQAPRR